MKTNLIRSCALAALAAAAAFAQQPLLVADIPVQFMAGDKTLPAGRYEVDRGPAASTVLIRSDDGKTSAIVLTNTAISPVVRKGGSLVLYLYGNTYALSEIWMSGTDGRRLQPTHRQRELAARVHDPGTIVIAALR